VYYADLVRLRVNHDDTFVHAQVAQAQPGHLTPTQATEPDEMVGSVRPRSVMLCKNRAIYAAVQVATTGRTPVRRHSRIWSDIIALEPPITSATRRPAAQAEDERRR
jgi:hypothetical protein